MQAAAADVVNADPTAQYLQGQSMPDVSAAHRTSDPGDVAPRAALSLDIFGGPGRVYRHAQGLGNAMADAAAATPEFAQKVSGNLLKGVGQMASAFLPPIPHGGGLPEEVPPGWAGLGQAAKDVATVATDASPGRLMRQSPEVNEAVSRLASMTNTSEVIRLGKRMVNEGPVAVMEDEPLAILGAGLGVLGAGVTTAALLGKAGRAGATAPIFRSADILDRASGDVRASKAILRELGAGRGVAKAMANRLSRAKTIEDVHVVLADAMSRSATWRQDMLARERKIIAGGDIQHLSSEARDAQQALWEVAAQADADEAKAYYRGAKAREKALRNRQQAEFKARRGQENIEKNTMRRIQNLASIPEDATPTLAQLEDSMKHQYRVNRATSVQDAYLSGIDRHTTADLARLPISDPFGPDGRLTVGKIARARQYMGDKFMSFEKADAMTSRLLGRESVLMSRTPHRWAAITAIKQAETTARMIEARAKMPVFDILKGFDLDGPELKWADAETVMPDGTISTNGRAWLADGRPEYFKGEKVPDQIRELGNAMGDVYEDYWKKINAAGKKWDPNFEIGRIKNYVPSEITQDARLALLARSGEHYDALAGWAKKNRGIDDLTGIAEKISPGDALYPTKRSSAIDYSRELNLPTVITMPNGEVLKVLETDFIKSFYHYVDNNSRRIASIEHFGPNSEHVVKLLDDMGNDFFGRNVMHSVWNDFQGIPKSPGVYTNVLGQAMLTAEPIARMFQLSGSVLPNITGTAWVARKWGLANTLRAQQVLIRALDKAKYPEEWQRVQIHRALGGIAEDVLNYLGETELASRGGSRAERFGKLSHKFLGKTGLKFFEGNTNAVAGIAASHYMEGALDVVKNGKEGAWAKLTGATSDAMRRELKRDFLFTDADIDRMVANGMDVHDKARVIQTAPALVNAWRISATSRPWIAKNPIIQSMLAYSSWARVRGHMVADAISEAKHFNFKPLAKELGYGVLTGEAVRGLKVFFKNQEYNDKNTWDRIKKDLFESSSFGYWGSIYESLKYVPEAVHGPFSTAAAVAFPPALEWYDGTYQLVGSAMQAYRSGRHADAQKLLDQAMRWSPAGRIALGTARRVTEPFGDPLGAELARKRDSRAIKRRRRREEGK